MKSRFFAVLGFLLLTTALLRAQAPVPAASESRMLRHVVSLKFKSTATPEQVAEVVKAFAELPSHIREVKGLEWGTNVSPEKHDKGFTHLFLLTFETEAARDAYLVHEAHRAFGAKLSPIMEDVFVVDYWTAK